VLVGFVLRLFLIFPGPLESKVEFFTNKADLRNYYWPAQAALRGENPYALWADGQSGEFRADMVPLELMIYVTTVAIWDDPRAIQILFALFDCVNIALLGALLRTSHLRLPFQIFYAFGPLTLYNLVLVPEDKTILLTLTFVIFCLLTRHSSRVTFQVSGFKFQVSTSMTLILTAALVASFKWLSVFYLLPLLLFVSRDARDFLKQGIVFAGIVALTHLPWIPAWLYVYTFRASRINSPMHIAPAALLNAAGLYDKMLLTIALIVSLGVIYAFFWFKRIDIFETIALSTAAGILWTPDMDPVHLAIVVIGLLLIFDWTRLPRLLIVWASSAWVAAVYALSTRAGFTRYGLPDLRAIVGAYGSPQMILLSYVLFFVVLAFYARDKLRGRAVGRGALVAEAKE
jgi:hypothetical protein